jgi:redox-sensitive bicupin YhaK (pirin superfamily)
LASRRAPYEFAPGNGKRGVGAHPHKGFETVNVVYQGEFEHRDSSGGGGKSGAGDVQWMTAGKGIVHEEFQSQDFTRKGATLQMIQLWVNSRAKDKNAKPAYQTLLKAQIPRIAFGFNVFVSFNADGIVLGVQLRPEAHVRLGAAHPGTETKQEQFIGLAQHLRSIAFAPNGQRLRSQFRFGRGHVGQGRAFFLPVADGGKLGTLGALIHLSLV